VILITKTVYIHEIKKIQWRTILARNVSHHCVNGNHFFSSVFAFLFVVLQALVATVLAAPSDVKERTLIADTFAGAAHHVAGAQEDFALGLIQGADQLAHPLGGLGGDYYGGGHLGSGHLGQEHLGYLGGGHLGHLGGEHLGHLGGEHLGHLEGGHLGHLGGEHLGHLGGEHLGHLEGGHLGHFGSVVLDGEHVEHLGHLGVRSAKEHLLGDELRGIEKNPEGGRHGQKRWIEWDTLEGVDGTEKNPKGGGHGQKRWIEWDSLEGVDGAEKNPEGGRHGQKRWIIEWDSLEGVDSQGRQGRWIEFANNP
jgi:hypothetical protein